MHQQGRGHFKQVARYKQRGRQRCQSGRRTRGLVTRVVGLRAFDQHLAALDAQHLTRAAGQGQREVAQAAKPVDHAFVRRHRQQAQSPRYQHAVDERVDLCEVGWLERHAHAIVGQVVRQLCLASLQRVQQLDGLRPFRLQPPLQPRPRGRKTAQARQVGFAQGLHVAQHHRCHSRRAVAGRVAAGQLDLRQGLARLHGTNEFAQRHQHVTDMLRQHMAAVNVSDVSAFALVKADQYHAFFAHIAHRQAGAKAVVPGRTFDGTHDVFGMDLAQMPEVVFEHALLDGNLRADVQMLHLAAATGAHVHAEMRTAGFDALRRFTLDGAQRGFFKTGFFAEHIGGDALEWQGAFDENHLAVSPVRNALGLHVQGLHVQKVRRVVGCQGPSQWFFFFCHAPIVSGACTGLHLDAGDNKSDSACRQVLDGINRLALAADLKVQLHAVCVAVAHFCDFLAPAYRLVFFDQEVLVVGIGGQVGVVVLQDNQVAVTTQTSTRIHHAAVGRGQHGLAGIACNVDAFVFDFIKAGNRRALGGPQPGDFFLTAG